VAVPRTSAVTTTITTNSNNNSTISSHTIRTNKVGKGGVQKPFRTSTQVAVLGHSCAKLVNIDGVNFMYRDNFFFFFETLVDDDDVCLCFRTTTRQHPSSLQAHGRAAAAARPAEGGWGQGQSHTHTSTRQHGGQWGHPSAWGSHDVILSSYW
jgi:hypothetical protein